MISLHQLYPTIARPLVRVLLILLTLAGIYQAFISHTLAADPATATQGKEPLFYTVQVGSYANEDEAILWYDRLAEALPDSAKDFLRIEIIAPFHTVRIGKAEKREEIIALFTEAQRITQRPPAIIHGYFKPERISKIHTLGATPPQQDQKKTHPISIKPAVKHEPFTDAKEESLDTVQGKPLPPRQGEKEKTTVNSSLPVPAPIKMPDAAMKQMIINKYTTDQTASKNQQDTLIKQSQSFPENPSCLTSTCHQTITSGKINHHPAQTSRCLACHQQVNQQHPDTAGSDFQLAAQGSDLCAQCHPRLLGKKYTHQPARDGECTRCHNPHTSDSPFLLNISAENQNTLCQECHDQEFSTKKYTHGPVGLGACTYCHSPHESDHKGLLKNDPQSLCFECHTDIAQGVKESLSIHKVVQTEGCVSCHLPHGSDAPSLLKESGEKFCFTCHDDIEDKFNKSRSKHGGAYLDKQCGTCHQPHYSPYEKLLNNKQLDLCISCHSDKKSTSAKAPKNIALELKKTFVHEPVAQGDCSGCHDPHGSKFLKLLTGPYPDTFYAPYDQDLYDLCFSCHDKELLTSQNTSKATSFRNGPANLHNLHASIPRKGRTCKTCHQPHASDGPKLINQTGSYFGEWQMSISFTTTTNGGTCMPGCHRKMEYNRDHAIDRGVKEPGVG
ncbi:MAG: hypothetical protein FP815_00150, partial [Desulfobulbaceae bacterium]|nr:hypothetical protein [Desulfobulbaceae bacterium]